jgi:hypothetical protein
MFQEGEMVVHTFHGYICSTFKCPQIINPGKGQKGTPEKFPSPGFMVLATTYSRTT